MNRRQMEMRFEDSRDLCRSSRPRRRLTRARWWFQQMRLVVDQTPDWDAGSQTTAHSANSAHEAE
jgi:hypothetical protein